MKCFEAQVETTNYTGGTFEVDGKYHACNAGKVYLAAANMSEAAKLLPDAKSIKEVGPFFVPVDN